MSPLGNTMQREIEQVSLLPGFVGSKLSWNGESDLHHIIASSCILLSCMTIRHPLGKVYQALYQGNENTVSVVSEGLWRWWITQGISGFLDFIHCPVFEGTRCLGNGTCFHPQVKGGKEDTNLNRLRLALSKGPNWVGVFFPPFYLRMETDPVSETSCSFKHRMMDKVQKPRNSFTVSVVHARRMA
jgi:hypothetical protein